MRILAQHHHQQGNEEGGKKRRKMPASEDDDAKDWPVSTRTPPNATTLAINVERFSDCRVTNHERPAARNGVVAKVTVTSATLARRKAWINRIVDSAEHIATNHPARFSRKTRRLVPDCNLIMKTRSARPPKMPRQKSKAPTSSSMSRVNKPAVLKAAADATTQRMPRVALEVFIFVNRT